ncbi:MAG: glycine cleavage system aminomethyltransferase GcvT [Gammaproteobacteria bacterium]|nr:glycine cleavage system aminomethyltransferase GcvT [Gammaproteobacteria bacterium]
MSYLKTTPLYPEHEKANATFVAFFGWNMPLHYGSPITEHLAVRQSAGMFDVSHMTVIDIIGAGCRPFLRRIMTRDIDEIKHIGGACYSCMCNEQGGVIDDVLIYYRGPDNYRLVFNAATKSQVLAWLNQHAQDFAIGLQVRHELCLIAIQGPKAIERIFPLLTPNQMDILSTLKRFNSVEDQQYFFGRTGYTGEDGLEIMLPSHEAITLWQKLIQIGIQPCGLAARDSLRLEAGLMLNGQDMDEHITPFQSALDWTISWKAHDREFIGKPSLLREKEQGSTKKLIGIMLEAKAILRHGQHLFLDNKVVGEITSGIFSPLLKKSIGFARIDTPAINHPLTVSIRDKIHPIIQTSNRFYTPPSTKTST